VPFNSYASVATLLPVGLPGFFHLGRKHDPRSAEGRLPAVLVAGYAIPGPRHILLLVASIALNFPAGGTPARP